MAIITNIDFVNKALTGSYIGTPYEKLDCQALMEEILKDCGFRYNWRGSNHMWRNALSEKHKITDWDKVPIGAWIFDVRNDGKEKQRGYNDDEGNACHVGLYLGNGKIIHSTTGGVQYDSTASKRWSHYGLCKYITYLQNNVQKPSLIDALHTLSESTLKEILNALQNMEVK